MTVEIREHRPGKDLRDFLAVPYRVYADDPRWVPPLRKEIRDRLNPARNPLFEHTDAVLFTAWKDGKVAGRISAQVDHRHLRRHNDGVGFFGFFDTIDDEEVAKALLERAARWLKARGIRTMRGPFSLSINEESGLLVDGFDTPPMVMMAHSRSYQGKLVEAAGLEKAKDLLAWRYEVGDIPPRAIRAWENIKALPELRIRTIRTAHMARELRSIMDVFNDAWSGNWGFVETTEAEVRKAARDLKLILDEEVALIAELHHKPVGIAVALPNINEAIADLNGRLSPLGLAKLLYRLKIKRPSSARLAMLGIRRELRGVKRYGGLSMALYVEMAKRGLKRGYRWGELSWTLEDNQPVNLGIRAMGGSVYKRYRVYERSLEGGQL